MVIISKGYYGGDIMSCYQIRNVVPTDKKLTERPGLKKDTPGYPVLVKARSVTKFIKVLVCLEMCS